MEAVASETLGDRGDPRTASDWCGYRWPNIRNRRFIPPTISQNERLLVAVVHPETVSPLSANRFRFAPMPAVTLLRFNL